MTLITLSTAWLIGIGAAHYANPPPALVGPLAVVPVDSLILWRDDPKTRLISTCW